MKLNSTLSYLLLFVFVNNCYAEDLIVDPSIAAAKTRAQEKCELDPINPKCEKLLDSKYRKMKDAEKEVKDIHFKNYDERRFKTSKLSELRAFCRLNKESARCVALKKHR